MQRTLIAISFALATLASPAASAQASEPVQPLMTAVDTQALTLHSSITPLDHLQVTVFREPDLSVPDVMVDESGHLALPLVGTVVAAGKSMDALSVEIAGRLKDYLKNPQVAVVLKQAASRRVTVTGSVIQPGVYPIEGRVTLLEAVALARGPSQVASMDQAFIFRMHDGQRTAARFNLKEITKGKANDPEVISDDTVTIGSSGFKTAFRDVLDTVRSFNIFRIVPAIP